MQCPNETELRKLIDGRATADEQAALAQHLDGCAACRATLDRLGGGRDSWDEDAKHLGVAEPAEPALAAAMDQLQADAGRNETAAEPTSGADCSLEFLAPPETPGHLGRLGHYEILEVVGQGGMGIVLKAQDTKLQRIVAIKVMMPELAARASARQRFIREARAAAAVTHEHVVTIHAVEEDHSPPYLVMQYVAGRSLQQRIDDCGALELKEILRIGLQAASGLAAAHAQGLVHRDIKPANILLENGVERVKITDFGLARAADDARLTQSGVVTGTPQYMSPEQAAGKSVDHRADLFSLGGVVYAMCTGYAPFRASSSMAVLKKVCDETPRPIRELNPELPDWLSAIVEKLMAKEPRQRFGSASEVAALLGQHLAHLQQPAVFPEPPEVARPAVAIPATPAPRWLTAALLASVVVPFLLNTALFAGWIPSGRAFDALGAKVGLIACEGIVFFVLLMMHLAADKRSLMIPSFMIAAPFVAVPLLIFVGKIHHDVLQPNEADGTSQAIKVFILTAIVLSVMGGVVGLILLPIRLARRGSRAWIPVTIGLIACFVLLPCAAGVVAVPMFFFLSEQEPSRSVKKQGPTDGPMARSDISPAATNSKLAPRYQERERILEALRWFPRDSTFFGVIDFTPLGSLTFDSPLVQALLEKMAPSTERAGFDQDNFSGVRLDRLSFAYVENPQKPGDGRLYLRLSGQFNRTRMTRFLQQNIKGATVRPGSGVGQDDVTFISGPNDPPAIALVGETDLLLAGYSGGEAGKPRHDQQLVPEALELRLYAEGAPAFLKPNLTAGSYEKELRNLPPTCFALVLGDLPEPLRQSASADGKGPIRAMPRFVSIAMTREPNAVHFEGRLPGGKEATMFAEDIARQIKDGVESLNKLPAQAQAAGLGQTLAAVKPVASGNMVTIDLDVPNDALSTLVAAVRALPPLYGSTTTAPVQFFLLKRFDPKVDKPITTSLRGRTITVEDGAWKIESNADELGSDENTPRLHLFKLPAPANAAGRVAWRFKVRTESPEQRSFFEARLHFATIDDITFKGRAIEGSSNWTTHEISFDPNKLIHPESVALDLVVRNKNGTAATVWIKDVEMVKFPDKP
jgi:tRNA A-37 threonylcarbamoyl transferase component Bud32